MAGRGWCGEGAEERGSGGAHAAEDHCAPSHSFQCRDIPQMLSLAAHLTPPWPFVTGLQG